MTRIFFKTVSALCYDLARTQMGPGAARTPQNDVTAFVLESWRGMPRFLAWPIYTVTVAFCAGTIFSTGRPYYHLAPARRTAHLESWRHSRFGMCRDLMRFYSSLAALALHSGSGTVTDSNLDMRRLDEAVRSLDQAGGLVREAGQEVSS